VLKKEKEKNTKNDSYTEVNNIAKKNEISIGE